MLAIDLPAVQGMGMRGDCGGGWLGVMATPWDSSPAVLRSSTLFKKLPEYFNGASDDLQSPYIVYEMNS
jgi:hypothetical protein